MPSALEKTTVPGIYKRGGRYVVVYRDPQGRQRKRSGSRTLAEARDLKATLRADVARGEYRAVTRVPFDEYALTWIDTYTGRTSRGIDEETRADYRRRLEQDAIPYFGRTPLAAIEPRHVKEYVARLSAPRTKAELANGRRKETIAPGTVRLGVAPVRALLATAFEEGLIRSNPAAGLRIATARETFDDEGESETKVKALSNDELARLLANVTCERCDDEKGGCPCGRWRLFLTFLAETGLRIGEAVELRWRDVDLGAGTVKVRRRFRRGKVGPPKSKYGRRTVRLAPSTARALWRLRAGAGEGELVFTSEEGARIDASNLLCRVVKPAAVRAGLGTWRRNEKDVRIADTWVGLHTLRHTCATRLFRAGRNAKQVQMWLGHHKASFTLDTYVHLLDEDVPEAVPVAGAGGNTGATRPAETGRDEDGGLAAVSGL